MIQTGRSLVARTKGIFQKFFLINDTPHKVAAGAALGIFLGISPGEGLASALILSSLLRFNRLAATAGVLAANMWTTIIILPIAAAVGGFMFNINSHQLAAEFKMTYDLGFRYFFTEAVFFDIAIPLFAGFFVVSGVISMSFYCLLLFLLKKKKLNFK